MRHIKAFFIFFIAVLSLNATAQTNDKPITLTISSEKLKSIKTFFEDFKSETLDFQYDSILEKTYPEIFSFSTKELMKSQLQKANKNSAYHTAFYKLDFENISKAFEFQGIKYYQIKYFTHYSFNFVKSESDKDSDFENYIKFMAETLPKKFPDMKTYREKNNIHFEGEKQLLLIENEKYNGLKMLELNKDLLYFYQMILPKEVIGEFQ